MLRMIQRTAQEGVLHHLGLPVRVYSEDGIQRERISRTVAMVHKAMSEANSKMGAAPKKLFEVGCGTADISGTLCDLHGAYGWHCYGIDCHQGALIEATLRYPAKYFTPIHAGIVPISEGPMIEVVVLAEVLEHLEKPQDVAASWLKRTHHSVISHPLSEDAGSSLSGGDHCWSLSEEDHFGFFAAGQHQIDETDIFSMGSYKIILSRGHHT